MSIKKKVSVRNAIFEALDNIGAQDHKMVPVLTVWATRADIKIKSAYAYEPKNFVFTAKGCSLELPCEIVFLDGIIAGDHGCDCDTLFDTVFNTLGIEKVNPDGSGNFLVVDINDGIRASSLRGKVINNTLWFDHDVNGQIFTLKTRSYYTDSEGFILVNENHVDAIAIYLEYKLAKRSRWNKKLGNITEMGIRDLRNDWRIACADARDDDEDEREHDAVVSMYNDPLSGGGNRGYFIY